MMSHDKLEPQVTLYHDYSTDKSCNRRVFSLTVGKVSLGRGGGGEGGKEPGCFETS